MNGHAVRAPVLNASLTDAVFELARPTSAEEVNALFSEAANNELVGILGYEEHLCISGLCERYAELYTMASTLVTDGTMLKVMLGMIMKWAMLRMVDLAKRMVDLNQ